MRARAIADDATPRHPRILNPASSPNQARGGLAAREAKNSTHRVAAASRWPSRCARGGPEKKGAEPRALPGDEPLPRDGPGPNDLPRLRRTEEALIRGQAGRGGGRLPKSQELRACDSRRAERVGMGSGRSGETTRRWGWGVAARETTRGFGWTASRQFTRVLYPRWNP